MTVAGRFWPRDGSCLAARERVFRVDEDTRVLALVDDPPGPGRDALVLLHGLTGSAESAYVVGAAAKALAAGLTPVRVNARNCGGTEHLTSRSYHGGLTADVAAVCAELVERDGVRRLHVAGFSIGGNVACKYAAELGDDPPAWLASVTAVSPCLDFAAAADRLDQGFPNRLYQHLFLRDLRAIVRRQHARHPDRFPLAGLDEARTIRSFDDRFTAPLGGFDGVDDYYARAAALPLLARIRVPTLLIAARDDPLVPFEPLAASARAAAPTVRLAATEHGGHVAFVGAGPASAGGRRDLDRLWAENRVVQMALAHGEERAAAW